MLKGLGNGSKLTKEQLNAIVKSSREYESTLSNLRATSEQILQQENAKLAGSRLGSQKMGLEAIVKSNEAFVAAGRASLKAQGAEGMIAKFFPGADKLGVTIDDILDMRDRRSMFDSQGMDKGLPDYKGAAEAEKHFNKLRAKIPKKEWDALNMTLDIRKREMENVKLGKQLAMLQTDFIEQQTKIQLRAIEMGSTRFMEFMARNPQIKNQGEALTEYIKQNEKELTSLYGASGYELLKTAPSFGIPKMAQGGIVSRPTVAMIGEAGPEAVVPLKRFNYATGGQVGGTTQIVTSIADVQMDGEKVGRMIVRTALTGRS
jgi:ASC-1-like (ASCH) protein